MTAATVFGPHQGQPVYTLGPAPADARAVVLLLHGRGSNAANILALADDFAQPDLAYLAPQALGGSWYPHSFFAPLESNAPCLYSALAAVEAVVERVYAAGVPAQRLALIGFSQGACLALEYAVRHARRYALLAALSGALVGPLSATHAYSGSLAETPLFLGCGLTDPLVPPPYVEHAATVLTALGAHVTTTFYPDLDHTVNHAELEHVRALLAAL